MDDEQIIHEKEDGWYFYDETWSNEYGPYDTKEETKIALDEYCLIYLS